MTRSEAVKILATHNRWRRCEECLQQDPTEIGLAIDKVISEIDQLETALNLAATDAEYYRLRSIRLHTAIEETINENGHLADGENSTLGKLVNALDKDDLKTYPEKIRELIFYVPDCRAKEILQENIEKLCKEAYINGSNDCHDALKKAGKIK